MKLEVDVDIDEIFQSAFTTAGSPNVDCNCGRQHVCIESYAFRNDEEDEQMRLEYIRRDKEDNDENLILHYGCDHMGVINLSGVIFAEDCECKGWEPYRNFVFQNRREIKNFLVRLAAEAQLALDQEATFNILKDKKLNVLDEPTF